MKQDQFSVQLHSLKDVVVVVNGITSKKQKLNKTLDISNFEESPPDLEESKVK